MINKKTMSLGMIITASILMLVGCFDTSSDTEQTTETSAISFDISSVDYAAVNVDENNLVVGARLLAAQCAQCHGTYGVAVRDWPDLWGSSREIGSAMEHYQDELEYGDNVMHLHALAYTAEEVELLKTYYPKVTYRTEGE